MDEDEEEMVGVTHGLACALIAPHTALPMSMGMSVDMLWVEQEEEEEEE